MTDQSTEEQNQDGRSPRDDLGGQEPTPRLSSDPDPDPDADVVDVPPPGLGVPAEDPDPDVSGAS